MTLISYNSVVSERQDSPECDFGSLRLKWGADTTVGRVRQLNEDSLLDLPGVFVVADGMGGHEAGEVASALVVETVRAALENGPPQIGALAPLVQDANLAVRRHAERSGSKGMGSTMVGAFVANNADELALVVVNIGDSRCYSVLDGHVRQVTVDHSHVQELVAAGEITPAEARVHRDRNVVTRAIGVDPIAAADFYILPPVEKERLMLCSDGVSGELGEEQLVELLTSHRDPQATAIAITEAVMQGRAADNATVVIIDVERQPVLVSEADGGLDADTQPRQVLAPERAAAAVPPLPAPPIAELVIPRTDERTQLAPVPMTSLIESVPGSEPGHAPAVGVSSSSGSLISEVMGNE